MPGKSNADSNKAPTLHEAPTLLLVPLPSEDLFTKFMKVFMERTQTQAQVLTEPREHRLKARTSEIYLGKSHMECYHFCQQYEDYFKTLGITRMNRTPFATSFLRGSISLRWAQQKRRHESATPIILSEFKVFLQKDPMSSQAFIDSIWSKFRSNSQYWWEEARDLASHLQHLQSILSEFDWAPNELTMICYFRKGLKLSIKIEMEQQDREAMNFVEMMQRAVNAEAEAGLRSSVMVWDSDIRCPQGHRPSNNTTSKMQTQGTSAKKLDPKESRTKEAKPAEEKASDPPRTNAVEFSEQDKKAKKDRKWRFRERKERSEDTPATGDNAIGVSKKKKKNRDCDTNGVTCYNCNKKGHFANTCTEPKN